MFVALQTYIFTDTYHVHGGNPACVLCQRNIQDATAMLLIAMLLFEKPKRKYVEVLQVPVQMSPLSHDPTICWFIFEAVAFSS